MISLAQELEMKQGLEGLPETLDINALATTIMKEY